MKNIHLLPTDNYSPLVYSTNKYGGLFLSKYYSPTKDMGDSYQNIYITSNEEIKLNDYVIQVNFEKTNTQVIRCETKFQVGFIANDKNGSFTKNKIILTTDQDLIKDGVQAIDDEFLEWFVMNPTCDEVDVSYEVLNTFQSIDKGYVLRLPDITTVLEEQKQHLIDMMRYDEELGLYEEPKKETTLEEAAENCWAEGIWDHRNDFTDGFKAGAKYQVKRMYTEEDLRDAYNYGMFAVTSGRNFNDWFKNFKKK